MADYNISAEITANTKGFESGVKKAQTASQKLSKSISSVVKGFGKSGLTGAITSAGLALGGIGLAIGTAVKAVKGITKALGECAEAYKTQLIAEKALDTAINNSPYISGTASKGLKDFASEMQKVSNLGDEEIIPQMTQLIATGRTEAEVMKIIATASDMSASGAMSFDQAVTQLNATLNGNIGRLGQQNAELKALTKEELESGKAVEILGEKYKGLAQATVDTKKQLQNAIGDLKETFGSVFENAMAPMRKFFTELIQGWADARKAKQDYEKAEKAVSEGKGGIEDLQTVIAEREKALAELREELAELEAGGEDWAILFKEEINIAKEGIKQTERELGILNAQLSNRQRQEELANKLAQEQTAQAEKEKEIVDLKEEYLKKVAEQEAKWRNIKVVTGEQVSNEEKIKFYQDSLVDLMTKAGGQITTNNQLYKDQMAIIEELAKGLEKQEKELADISKWNDKLLQQEKERLQNVNIGAEDYNARKKNATEIYLLSLQQLQNQEEADLKSVEGTANAEEARKKIVEYYANERLALQRDWNEQLADISNEENEAEIKAKKEAFNKMAGLAKNYAKQMASIFSKMAKTISNVFKEITSFVKSAFSKLFKFDTNDALDSLLKFEDSILTFFVETLPQMPSFLESALQSIEVLLNNLDSLIDENKIAEIVEGMVKSLSSRLPRITKTLMNVGKKLLFGLIKGVTNNLPEITKTLYTIKDEATNALREIIPALTSLVGTLLREGIPFLISTAFDIIDIICENFPAFAQELIKTLPVIVESVVENLPRFFEESLPKLIQGIADIIPELFKATGDIIVTLVNNLPKIVFAIIEGITKLLKELSAEDIAKLVTSVIKMVADVASALLSNIGQIVAELIPLMVTLTVELIKSIPDIIKGLATGVWEGIKGVGEAVWEGIKDIGSGLKDLGSSIVSGLKSLFGFATGTNNAPKGLALVGEQGPELIRFNGGEQVLNTRNTQKALAGIGSGGNTFNVTFENTIDTTAYAMMSQLKQYNRQMAINGVI